MTRPAKPTVGDLGIDVDAVTWRRSGDAPGAVEVAFVDEWVLMRAGDQPDDHILVFDHGEWDAFVRGAKDHEFDPPDEHEPG